MIYEIYVSSRKVILQLTKTNWLKIVNEFLSYICDPINPVNNDCSLIDCFKRCIAFFCYLSRILFYAHFTSSH